MKKAVLFLCILLMIFSCSSSKMIQQYKNPVVLSFKANKVLVIGVSSDKELRAIFEKRVVNALEKENVNAVKSIDFFESEFRSNKQSMEQLNSIENKLLDAGFDAILFAKVTDKESRITLVYSYMNFKNKYQTFGDYYYHNQHLNYKEEAHRYQVYTTETSLFCICSAKERSLVWHAEIEVIDAHKVNRNMNQYLQLLVKSLRENQLLVFVK